MLYQWYNIVAVVCPDKSKHAHMNTSPEFNKLNLQCIHLCDIILCILLPLSAELYPVFTIYCERNIYTEILKKNMEPKIAELIKTSK